MIITRTLLLACLFFIAIALQASSVPVSGSWRAVIERKDGEELPFNFELTIKKGKYWIAVKNASEKLPPVAIQNFGDSLQFEMPFFEASFRFKLQQDGSMRGWYLNYTATSIYYWKFRANPGQSNRFIKTIPPLYNVSGRWALAITRPNGTIRPAIAELQQQGGRLTGTILTPSGDYRFLEGVVTNDSLFLSGFNAGQAYLIKAHLKDANRIDAAVLYSGYAGMEKWVGEKNAQAALQDVGNVPKILNSDQQLDFRFPDTDSVMLSLKDKRFDGKLVIIQAMGSWCPNCMDEANYLNSLYRKYQSRGLEIVALAYELSTDFERSRKSLLKIKQKLGIDYPMLITGVSISDSLRTEKTLPKISPIKVFPTLLVVGSDKKIKLVEAGFYGPGSGKFYELHKKEFEDRLEKWLK